MPATIGMSVSRAGTSSASSAAPIAAATATSDHAERPRSRTVHSNAATSGASTSGAAPRWNHTVAAAQTTYAVANRHPPRRCQASNAATAAQPSNATGMYDRAIRL